MPTLSTTLTVMLALASQPLQALAQTLSPNWSDQQLKSLQWYPSIGTGGCSGSYRVPQDVKRGVIATAGTLLEGRSRYANLQACSWGIVADPGSVVK
ncbi:hypothetical protein HDU67_005721, partial [Dinochytrium kinnereticum]